LRSGTLKLLYVAPERFNNERFLDQLGRCRISLFAGRRGALHLAVGAQLPAGLPEAAETARTLGVERILALTATATPAVVRDICDSFGIAPAGAVVTGLPPAQPLPLHAPVASAGRDGVLVERIRSRPPGPGSCT
jgi:ATP-dependent DNA helicase RecQ